jgi:hypothetical protein
MKLKGKFLFSEMGNTGSDQIKKNNRHNGRENQQCE